VLNLFSSSYFTYLLPKVIAKISKAKRYQKEAKGDRKDTLRRFQYQEIRAERLSLKIGSLWGAKI